MSGISTNFIYDGQDVVKDLNSDGTAIEYLNGPGIDNKIRQKGANNNSTYYFSNDHLGSTTALTGTTGKLGERTTYDAYGNSSGSTTTPTASLAASANRVLHFPRPSSRSTPAQFRF